MSQSKVVNGIDVNIVAKKRCFGINPKAKSLSHLKVIEFIWLSGGNALECKAYLARDLGDKSQTNAIKLNLKTREADPSLTLVPAPGKWG
ncbi:MAG: hypothetical protein ABFS56_05350 [Pseudomonadota bacterium]